MKAVELFEIQRLTLRRRGSKLYVYVQRDKLYEDILKSLEKEIKKKDILQFIFMFPRAMMARGDDYESLKAKESVSSFYILFISFILCYHCL